MREYILNFSEIDSTRLAAAGGKGLNLGALSKTGGISVPDGFCITTRAYERSIENNDAIKSLTESLAGLHAGETARISEICGKIRSIIENISIPIDIAGEIRTELSKFGENQAFAIRSSATAEDLPDASFAGQQDTYLNIRGVADVLRHTAKCWASLFTDRAAAYRIKNGIDHRTVSLAVVVQKMIMSEASGIMFTADPVTSDRKTVTIDAGFGLGEALVSGLVDPDIYRVGDDRILSRKTGSKSMEVRPDANGGTVNSEISEDRRKQQVLSDDRIFELYKIGKAIESHFGCPQDIEWCLADDEFHIVQSRPITTLFPIPSRKDGRKRVYISSAHMQVMTDPILPLGMSILELSSLYPLYRSGGRLFLDVTHDLATPQGRRMVRNKTEIMDPLMWNAISMLIRRRDFIRSLPKGKASLLTGVDFLSRLRGALRVYRKNDPAIFDEMIASHMEELERVEGSLGKLSGTGVFDFISEDKKELLAAMYDPKGFGAILACMFAAGWLNRNIEKWLGEKNVTGILSKSVERNITSEMGLALCDIADIIRRYPEVYDYCRNFEKGGFLEGLTMREGGRETVASIEAFLYKYGMRCTAEIDITRSRWYEQPEQLIPMIMSDIKLLKPGEHINRYEQGIREAEQEAEEILQRLSQLHGGMRKAKKAKRMISIFRNFLGAREYPKYFLICRYAIYKRALLREAGRLAEDGVIKDIGDVFYLFIEEFREAVKTRQLDYSLIEERRREYARFEKLTPPRIIMSDGEVPCCGYEGKSIPKGALAGVPVSPGVVEGRARVVERLEDAQVEQGDILVTAFTDPSWTPVFILISGLVTEVGGIMSHGAVITREYGLPAVAGVGNAVKLIKDGQRIRLNGSEGYVEIL